MKVATLNIETIGGNPHAQWYQNRHQTQDRIVEPGRGVGQRIQRLQDHGAVQIYHSRKKRLRIILLCRISGRCPVKRSFDKMCGRTAPSSVGIKCNRNRIYQLPDRDILIGGKPKTIFTCWKETPCFSIVGMQVSISVSVNGYSGI
jgi:hypothetical protein